MQILLGEPIAVSIERISAADASHLDKPPEADADKVKKGMKQHLHQNGRLGFMVIALS